MDLNDPVCLVKAWVSPEMQVLGACRLFFFNFLAASQVWHKRCKTMSISDFFQTNLSRRN